MARKRSAIISLILFILVICVILFFGYHPQYSRKKLGLLSFYGSEDFYLEILENKNTDSNIEVPNSNSIKVDPLAGPYLGWKTEGKPAANPTKVAATGLYAILNKNVPVAQAHAQWLKEHSVTKEKSLFYPFQVDLSISPQVVSFFQESGKSYRSIVELHPLLQCFFTARIAASLHMRHYHYLNEESLFKSCLYKAFTNITQAYQPDSQRVNLDSD